MMVYLIWLQANLLWAVRCAIDLEKAMVSFERVKKITEIPQEAFDKGVKPNFAFPNPATIEFDNYRLRY